MKEFTKSAETLKKSIEEFATVLRKRTVSQDPDKIVHITFFAETQSTKIGIIADEDAAWIPGCGERVAIATNHHTISKFEKSNEGYKLIVGQLRKLISRISEDSQPPAMGVGGRKNQRKAR